MEITKFYQLESQNDDASNDYIQIKLGCEEFRLLRRLLERCDYKHTSSEENNFLQKIISEAKDIKKVWY